ncbi:MAG TPA: MBL fold metallo-hydrolase [Phycisphaerae bacterium]|nr:MBL fold metallo-hydrolase [Phycisphaerae bacterium]
MEIHFHGATQTVTGSLHEIRGGGKTILLDCGLFQGPRELAKKINCCFDFDPTKIDAVILSHAHTDHCGNLPNLIKQGYKGPIYCTAATAAITAFMLMDSAKIQEEDAAYLNQKTQKSWQGTIEPLYTREDAQKTISLFKPLEYKNPLDLGGLIVEFHDAGHTLGSAAIKVTEPPTGKILVFSGDVGRPNAPLLHDPDPFLKADALISECTYGGKVHGPMATVASQLADVINRTAQRGGVLMVPAFALGRTQVMIEEIHLLRDQKKIPASLPIYIDSPLATRITQVHRDFENLLDEETRRMLEPFDFPNLTYVSTSQESMALNSRKDPFIVIAGSGMCESGRILHHLKHHISDSRSTVLLPGFQAQNTLGRRIQDRQRSVPILGDIIPLNCEVDTLEGLSAHADGPELLQYTAPLKPTRVYLVHGELPQAHAHQSALQSHGFPQVTIPARGDLVTV